jgi:hypothetical protein
MLRLTRHALELFSMFPELRKVKPLRLLMA